VGLGKLNQRVNRRLQSLECLGCALEGEEGSQRGRPNKEREGGENVK